MKKLLVIVAVLSCSYASASTITRDTSGLRQLSFGFNALRLMPHYAAFNPASVGFVQYRKGSNALRVGFSNAGSYSENAATPHFPDQIFITDTTIIVGDKYNKRVGNGVSIEYLTYTNFMKSKAIQFHGGIGIYGGMIDDQNGYRYTLYSKDSLGVYRHNEQISSSTDVDHFNSTKGYQIGIIPTVGFVLMPFNAISIGLELRVPVLHDEIHSYDKANSMSGFSLDTQLACNLIFNLDISKN